MRHASTGGGDSGQSGGSTATEDSSETTDSSADHGSDGDSSEGSGSDGDSSEGSGSDVAPSDPCAAFFDENSCVAQGCEWFIAATVADAAICDTWDFSERFCATPEPGEEPVPTTYFDASGALFVEAGYDPQCGPDPHPMGWQECTISEDAPEGCACMFIEGQSPGGRAMATMADCGFPSPCETYVGLYGYDPDPDPAYEEVARCIAEALAAGDTCVVRVERSDSLGGETAIVYALGDGRAVGVGTYYGDVFGCDGSGGQFEPATCILADPSYFTSCLAVDPHSCMNVEQWLEDCVGGPVTCEG